MSTTGVRPMRLLVAVVGVLVLALLVGVAPRIARHRALTAEVAANTGVTTVSVATADTAPATPSVTLPGSVAALPYVDVFASGHSLASLEELGSALE